MTIQRSFRVLASAALLLSLAACGGGGGDASADSPAAGGSTSVTIQDNAFDPAGVDVSAGDTVDWANNDDAPHTVTFDNGSVDSSDELAKGDSFSATFDEAGVYGYVCKFHPDMKGTVTVS